MAALYAVLAGFAVRLLRTAAPVASCGCFGADAPPSRLHAGFDAAAAAVAALALAARRRACPSWPPARRWPASASWPDARRRRTPCRSCSRHLPQAALAYRPGRGAA